MPVERLDPREAFDAHEARDAADSLDDADALNAVVVIERHDVDDADPDADDDDAQTPVPRRPSITRNLRVHAGAAHDDVDVDVDDDAFDDAQTPVPPLPAIAQATAGDARGDEGGDEGGDEAEEDDDDGGVPTLTDEELDEPTRPRESPLDLLIRTENEGAYGTAFFQPLPAEHRQAVLDRFHAKSVKKGTTVIRQGEVGHSLVVVLKGQLLVRVDRKGGPVDLGVVGTGEFVGEGSLLARTPSQVHISAGTDAELLLLPPRDFYEIAGAFPALWAELKDVAERRKRDLEMAVRRR